MELYKSDNLSITKVADRPIVICTWTKKTGEISFEEYMEEYWQMLQLVLDHKLLGIIADERDLRFQIEEKHLRKFHDTYIRFNFSGLRGYAHIKHEEFVEDYLEELDRPQRLPIYLEDCFSDIDEALEWSNTAIKIEKGGYRF